MKAVAITEEVALKMMKALKRGRRIVIGSDYPMEPDQKVAEAPGLLPGQKRSLRVKGPATRDDFIERCLELDIGRKVTREEAESIAHAQFYYELEAWDFTMDGPDGAQYVFRIREPRR